MSTDREKRRAIERRWRNKNKEHLRQRQKEYYREHPDIYLLNACASRAKKQGLEFNLERKDLMFPTHCPVFGFPFEHGTRGFHEQSPSIDRINPKLGYVKGNVIVVSFKANRMKQTATVKELRQLADFYEKLEREMNSPSNNSTV